MKWPGMWHVLRRMLMGKPEGTRIFGKPKLRWEDNIKRDLKEIGRKGLNWFNLAQDRD